MPREMIVMVADKILIVEDDDDISMILKKNLEKESYVVIRASDGYEALYKYLKEKPSMVILDVMIPKLDGYEVCREIRRAINDNTTPIIMMTAQSGEYGRIKGKVRYSQATQYVRLAVWQGKVMQSA